MIGIPELDSRRGLGIFLFTTAFRTALGPTQTPIQWVTGALSVGVKRPRSEANHSPQSRAAVKNAWNYTSTPTIRGQLHLYLTLFRVSTMGNVKCRHKTASWRVRHMPLYRRLELYWSWPENFLVVLKFYISQPPTEWVSGSFPRG
jgi:hypothetical protein